MQPGTFKLILPEVPIEYLAYEVGRRAGLRSNGMCDYCARPWDSSPPCKHEHRHSPTFAERRRVPTFGTMPISTKLPR